MIEFEEWAARAASEVVAHIERHGLSCTWTEAHERLLGEAGRGPHRILVPVEEADVEESDHVFVTNDGESMVSLHNPRDWRDPDFVEDVACTHVHWLGKPYYPADPEHSTVSVAVPLTVVTETVQRLNFLLHAHLQSPGAYQGYDDVAELARVATCLGADVSDELEHVVDQRNLDEELVDGSDVILSRSSDVFAAARLLEEGSAAAASVNDDGIAWMSIVRNRETLRDLMHIEFCIRSLHWWLGIGWAADSKPFLK